MTHEEIRAALESGEVFDTESDDEAELEEDLTEAGETQPTVAVTTETQDAEPRNADLDLRAHQLLNQERRLMRTRTRPLFLHVAPGRGESDIILLTPGQFRETAENIAHGLVAYVRHHLGAMPVWCWFTDEAVEECDLIRARWDPETRRVCDNFSDDQAAINDEHNWWIRDELANVDDVREQEAAQAAPGNGPTLDLELANQLQDCGQSVASVGAHETGPTAAIPAQVLAAKDAEIAAQLTQIAELAPCQTECLRAIDSNWRRRPSQYESEVFFPYLLVPRGTK